MTVAHIDWRIRLRDILDRSGMTRSQVCHEAGLNPAYLTQILEQKGATPRVDNLKKIACVLDTSVAYLVDGIPLEETTVELLALFDELRHDRKVIALAVLRDMAAAQRGLEVS